MSNREKSIESLKSFIEEQRARYGADSISDLIVDEEVGIAYCYHYYGDNLYPEAVSEFDLDEHLTRYKSYAPGSLWTEWEEGEAWW